MKLVLFTLWLLTTVSLFGSFPADEAAVRSAVIGIAYVVAYVVVRSIIRLVQRLRRIGR